MKTLQVTVKVEIFVDPKDDDAIKEAVNDRLMECVDNDEVEYTVEESDEDEDEEEC